ncbi:hypothetical protein ATANTOWER_020196 [Ataeniobius toweri]|uniref:Uncharacterized protein n=1 Tax=Ataeniobius toweri TaxID=208326 RepID=A0ABU7BL59_9TELE|nr:hypothetical protein [Ataeniobius toweri]
MPLSLGNSMKSGEVIPAELYCGLSVTPPLISRLCVIISKTELYFLPNKVANPCIKTHEPRFNLPCCLTIRLFLTFSYNLHIMIQDAVSVGQNAHVCRKCA